MSYKHLVYGLPMINDVIRNTFYKNILENVKNKRCLEIGFGSGILSILALEQGAKTIIAYEEDIETYELGTKVINSLNLQDRIELINERFNADKIHRHDVDCIFTETINHTLFGESMLDSVNGILPEILPNNYFLEVYAIPVNNNYAKRLLSKDSTVCNPGLAIDERFSKTINTILGKQEINLTAGLHGITIGNLDQVLRLYEIHNQTPIQSYNIDINKPLLQKGIDWTIPLEHNENYLIVFRTGMSYKEHKLYTDVSENWGPFAQYALIINANSTFRIEQNFNDGNFILSYNDQQIYLIKEETKHNYNIAETDKTKVVIFEH